MLTRRHLLALIAAASLPVRPSLAARPGITGGGRPLRFGPPEAFSWDGLVAMARRLNETPYEPRPDPAPEVLSKIGYRQHSAIYQPAEAGLYAAPGRDGVVTAFHLGELFRRPVRLNALKDGMARQLLYREDYFSYPVGSPAAEMPDDAGFAGFRVHEPWRRPGQPGDWLVFLGASYFRSSGDLRQYGMSARGLALDTAAPDGGKEEFPDFTDFWIEEMQGGVMTIFALLQGPSVTGAFRFDVSHFPHVVMETTCRFFLRQDVGRLGVAPLTSMYWYSQERRWANGDWRPEVHDSDGLLLKRKGGDRLWRPLRNPREVVVSSFPAAGLEGFGLMQRDRDYSHYQDRAAFERRPNLWVEPLSGFGDGEIQLVELPTEAEYGDNIVAFFVPRAPAKAGNDYAFRYRLHWSGTEPETRLARLEDLRLGRPRAHRSDTAPDRIERKVILDFVGEPLGGADPRQADARIVVEHGRVFRPRLSRSVDRSDGWRLEFDVFTEGPERCEGRVELTLDHRRLSETVIFGFSPHNDLPV